MDQPRANLISQERSALESAVCSRSVEDLTQVIDDVHTRLFPEGRFDTELINLLAELLSRPDVLSIPHAWTAISVIDYDLRDLPADQADALVPFAERVFADTTDSSMAFEMSCWLGEYFHTRTALDALVRLKHSAGPNGVWAVPHGLEHVVRDATDAALKSEALRHLRSMGDFDDPDVRREVAVSLERLKNRGLVDDLNNARDNESAR